MTALNKKTAPYSPEFLADRLWGQDGNECRRLAAQGSQEAFNEEFYNLIKYWCYDEDRSGNLALVYEIPTGAEVAGLYQFLRRSVSYKTRRKQARVAKRAALRA